MEIDGNLLSGTQLWWLAACYGTVMFFALRMAPWRRLLRKEQLNVFMGTVVALIVLWHLRGEIQPGLSFHLLGLTTVTLMLGWSMAVIAASLTLLAVCLNAGYGWDGFIASALTVILIPITLTQLCLVLARSWLPKHFFIYVLGNGFFTAWVVAYVSGYVAVELLVMSGSYAKEALEVTIIPFFPMMFFPEAIINGWIITILVLFCPTWVHSFSDEQYVKGK